jgi:hypothetical protein
LHYYSLLAQAGAMRTVGRHCRLDRQQPVFRSLLIPHTFIRAKRPRSVGRLTVRTAALPAVAGKEKRLAKEVRRLARSRRPLSIRLRVNLVGLKSRAARHPQTAKGKAPINARRRAPPSWSITNLRHRLPRSRSRRHPRVSLPVITVRYPGHPPMRPIARLRTVGLAPKPRPVAKT